MTTTPNLNHLATDPQAFDTILAGMHTRREAFIRAAEAATDNLHRLAGDRKSYRHTRVPVWGLGNREVELAAQRQAAHGDQDAISVLRDRAAAHAMVDALQFEIANMDAVYMRQGNRWTRFFPSVTKSQPHIHRSLTCRTLHAATVMTWAPQLSGKTDEQAVAELDEALCSVCFPDAPVVLHNHVSQRSQAERDQRQAEKDARDALRAAKQLTEDEQFKTSGRFSERVTTVAKCKELIRKAVEEAVELDWYTSPAADKQLTDWTPEQRAQRERNARVSLDEARKDAAEARRVLIAREARHEGYGMTEADIDAMMARKDKSARKEWFK